MGKEQGLIKIYARKQFCDLAGPLLAVGESLDDVIKAAAKKHGDWFGTGIPSGAVLFGWLCDLQAKNELPPSFLPSWCAFRDRMAVAKALTDSPDLRDSVARLTAERDLAKAEAERATAQLVAVKDQAEKQRKALEDGFAARESLRKRAEEAAEQWAAARDELDAVRAMLAEETRRASQLAERVGELESRPPAQMSEEAVTEALIRKLLALDGIDTARIIAKLLGGK